MSAVFLLVFCLSITPYGSLAEDVSSWGTGNMMVYRTSQPEIGQQLEAGCVGTWMGVQTPDSCRWVGPWGDSWTVADGQVRRRGYFPVFRFASSFPVSFQISDFFPRFCFPSSYPVSFQFSGIPVYFQFSDYLPIFWFLSNFLVSFQFSGVLPVFR